MSYFGAKDFFFEVAKEKIPGHSAVNIFGMNSDVDLAAAEDTWGQGGTWVAPTAARIHDIASGSANDTAAGTGARTISIIGLDGSYNEVTENITLNGVANVATINSYFFISNMKVITAGSTGANEADITATAQTDATVTNVIKTGLNESTLGIYQIPVGYNGYITAFQAEMQNATAAATADISLLVKEFGGVYALKADRSLINSGTTSDDDYYYSPLPFSEKAIIKTRATVNTNNTTIKTRVNIILVAQ